MSEFLKTNVDSSAVIVELNMESALSVVLIERDGWLIWEFEKVTLLPCMFIETFSSVMPSH